MKVLYLNPGGSAQGGAERSLALLVQTMVSNGHEAYVAVLLPGDAAELFAHAGATVLRWSVRLDRVRRHGTGLSFAVGAARSAPAIARLAYLIRHEARELGVEIVHSNGFRTHLLAPLLYRGGPRQVWSLRDRAPRRSQRAALAVASLAVDAVVANSDFTAEQLAWRRGFVDVVPNPICVGAVPGRDQARLALGLPLDRPVVAVVAHLHRSKGHHVAVEAMARWVGDDRPCLAIAGGRMYGEGSEHYERELRRLISGCGLDDDVVLLGGVTDVGPVYASADLLMQPAVYPEGFGRVVVEAQLAGVPVVATGIGGARELIENGRSGLLVPAADPTALRVAAARVLGDPRLALTLVAGGRVAARRFSMESHFESMERVYRRVLSQ